MGMSEAKPYLVVAIPYRLDPACVHVQGSSSPSVLQKFKPGLNPTFSDCIGQSLFENRTVTGPGLNLQRLAVAECCYANIPIFLIDFKKSGRAIELDNCIMPLIRDTIKQYVAKREELKKAGGKAPFYDYKAKR